MKKIAIILAVIAVFALGAYYVLAGNESANTEQTTPNVVPADNESTDKPAQTGTSQPVGQYIDYKDGVVQNTTGVKILFFHAPWCPQCQALEADIKAKGVPSGVSIIKVDYDTNQALRQKYGVTIQTTLVKVDNDGNLVDKYVAYDYPTLVSVQENLL